MKCSDVAGKVFCGMGSLRPKYFLVLQLRCRAPVSAETLVWLKNALARFAISRYGNGRASM